MTVRAIRVEATHFVRHLLFRKTPYMLEHEASQTNACRRILPRDSEGDKRVRIPPYTSALVRHSGFWRPAYVIEQDSEGRSVIFLPDIPNTDQGQVLLAMREQIQIVPSL